MNIKSILYSWIYCINRTTFLDLLYKTIKNKIMNRTFLFILAVFFSLGVFCQEEQVMSKKEQRKLAKEQRKADKVRAEAEMREVTALMLEYQRFVLEANYVGDKIGNRIPVSNLLNFIAVDSNDVVLQLGSHFGIGINGVGGVTVEGRVTKYEVQKREGKKGASYYVVMYITSSAGMYDISMNVSELGYTDATVRGNTSGQLRYSGELVPISLSRVYKGQTNYF